MIKIAIVDDSTDYIKIISDKINSIMNKLNYDTYEITIFTDGMQLVERYMEFNLLLLDIDMPIISGFELADRISNGSTVKSDVSIIYISTYEELVYESFKYSPFRFIRKSKLDDELFEAIQAFLNKTLSKKYHLMFSTDLGKRSISINDIFYIEVISHKLYIHEQKQLTIANGNLKDVEEQLRIYGFIKTHQSFLVNFRYINFIKHNEVILDDGAKIPLSRGRYDQVKKEYMVLTREI